MLPLRDENPTYTAPVVTITIIVMCVVVFVYELMVGLDLATFRFALIPAELTQGIHPLYPVGDSGVENLNPAWLTVFTSMFMHGSWTHILSNMWYLWIFGNNIEEAMGKAKFIAFYLICGGVAAAAQALLGPDSLVPMVGASGAIAGVLGAYLVLYPGSRVLCLILTFIITTIEVPAFIVLGFWFLLQVFSGVVHLGPHSTQGGVAYAAHVGGFVAGIVLARVFAGQDGRPPRQSSARPDFMDYR